MALPIESCLEPIIAQLKTQDNLVIQAPPGAGKTTLVPLALLQSNQYQGRILLIQPRRLAVYGAAQRMADLCEEATGERIGYTTRFDQKTSARTRIEVITEGIFLRLIQDDPSLTGIDVIIFDEFHERSATIDLGLAFALEAQQGFREANQPLKLIIMSATLDGQQLSDWLDAPLIQSAGRSFPVTTYFRPPKRQQTLAQHISLLVKESLQQHPGSILVFLPGMKEINRVYNQLMQSTLGDNVSVFKLHASLAQDKQRAAIAPAPTGHYKVVLTTNVAETSITIEGVSCVIDSGLVRVAQYDERRGMNVLVTERLSAASAEQRCGRAGRTAEGFCYRTWSEPDHKRLKPFSDPEIMRTDLLPIALELAIWGCRNPADLMLLTQPKEDKLRRAQQLLYDLDATTHNGTITNNGKQLAKMGLHPRLANLILISKSPQLQSIATATAALLSEGDPLRFHQQLPQSDIYLRLALWESKNAIADVHQSTWLRVKKLAQQLMQRAGYRWQRDSLNNPELAEVLCHAFPDHIAKCRANSQHRYLLANGKGAQLNPEDGLAGTPYLVVLDAHGNEAEPYIRLACPLREDQLLESMAQHLENRTDIIWDQQKQAAEAVATQRLGDLILRREKAQTVEAEALSRCLMSAISATGLDCLPWDDAANRLRARVQWLHQQQPSSWPDWTDTALVQGLETWLYPFLTGMTSFADLQTLDMATLLKSTLPWDQHSLLDELAPERWQLPTGSERMIGYDTEKGPVLSARMQELYGLEQHPTLKSGIALLIEILSPADRPIQLTRDLPGFWQGSYQEVAKEMRGRYPKHYWPDEPAKAQATRKTKKHM